MDMVAHHCRTCGRTPEQTAFRLNGSGQPRADCNECERTKQKMKRQEWRGKPDDTPQIADGYTMMPYQGAVIAWDADGGMVCLTDLYRATGSPEGKDPYRWLNQDGTKEYIEECRRQGLINTQDVNSLSRRGAHGGTWREQIIALAYAQYLSAALYVACNKFILDKWGQARQGSLVEQDRALLRAVAEHLGVLPRMEAKIDGIGQTLAGAERIERTQYHRGRIYVGLLIDPLTIQTVRRELANADDSAIIVFIGQTKPGEGQEQLRIRDYSSKLLKIRPSYYELLAAFDTDNPDEAERLLLNNPPRGAVQAILENRKRSQSFHIISARDALTEYRQLARSYYAVPELQASWKYGPLQQGLW